MGQSYQRPVYQPTFSKNIQKSALVSHIRSIPDTARSDDEKRLLKRFENTYDNDVRLHNDYYIPNIRKDKPEWFDDLPEKQFEHVPPSELPYREEMSLGERLKEETDPLAEIQALMTTYRDDKDLAMEFQKRINPKYKPNQISSDGHCAECASRTHHALKTGQFNAANLAGTFENNKFNNYFTDKIAPQSYVQNGKTPFPITRVTPNTGETLDDFKGRVSREVMNNTKKGNPALLGLGWGTHWYNAYNDAPRVRFIDSQSGRGFNLYDENPNYTPDPDSDMIDIFPFQDTDHIVDYFNHR